VKLQPISICYWRNFTSVRRPAQPLRGNAPVPLRSTKALGVLRAGMLLAQAGFLSEARRILNDLHAHVDIPRLVAARHRLAGEIALVERAPRRALREFQEAAVISPARECMEQIARALDATGDLNQAIAAYKKITETPALFWPGPQTDIPGLQSESRRRYAELVTNLTLKEKK
jgi:hypothetical protein